MKICNGATEDNRTKNSLHHGWERDNAWHASAMLNGKPVFVVWNREGQVVTEGD